MEIKLHDKFFIPYISAEELDWALSRMATQIAAEMHDEVPVFVGVLNGSFMVVSDLLKHYKKPCEVSFCKMASYEGLSSTNEVKELIGLNQDLTNRTVVIVEDIVDTGNTVEKLCEIFSTKNLKKLKIATLFLKPEVYKKEIKIDYIGIEIENAFIVGFGLDYDGLGRNLPEVYRLK